METSSTLCYIRSKIDPTMYWHYKANTSRVVISNFQRAMFSVVARNVPERTVMRGFIGVATK
ncbi:hypothetical protein BDN71DRAFT_1444443 [Pleurotus eryngii]|uniref:Uncharacterized protein n=1 Tax=Pleurotus eryngii TaxID=5323 RepID=A0A9P6A237_PLEER|nr:hypothetical protein BDN71DRAFT_1444443 [Pleurotus eryngii]